MPTLQEALGNRSIADLADVSLSGLASGEVLKSADGSTFANGTDLNTGGSISFSDSATVTWSGSGTGPFTATAVISSYALSNLSDGSLAAKTDTANVFTEAQQAHAPVIAVSGTTKTLALTDRDSLQNCSNASTQTITIPLNSAVAFPTGTAISFVQAGAGIVTITATSGVTLRGVDGGSLSTSTVWDSFTIIKTGTDAWIAIGNLS